MTDDWRLSLPRGRLWNLRHLDVIAGAQIGRGGPLNHVRVQRIDLIEQLVDRCNGVAFAVLVFARDLAEEIAVLLAVSFELTAEDATDDVHLTARELGVPDERDLVKHP